MKKWGAFFAVLAVAACDDVNVHILSGQLYVPQDNCIEPSTGIDVVNGGSTGDNCAPLCLTITSGDATSVYVTTMCPPYPQDPGYITEAEDAATSDADPCMGAFAAYESEGGLCPAVLPEAGGEADAAGDGGTGSSDAGAEAGDATTADGASGDAAGE
jgi:hypothetical protein